MGFDDGDSVWLPQLTGGHATPLVQQSMHVSSVQCEVPRSDHFPRSCMGNSLVAVMKANARHTFPQCVVATENYSIVTMMI